MFETKSAKEVLQELEVDQKVGLTNNEVLNRRKIYKENKLEEKKKKPIVKVFFSQFNDPMILILLAAALLSVAISIYSVFSPNVPVTEKPSIIEIIADPIIILAVVIINALIGTIQESKAEKSLEALKKMSSPTCIVRRESNILEIKAEELVPGDIVILEEGRTVPADLRLLETINLKIDESSLTGESLPIEKDSSIVFSDKVGLGDKINLAFMSTPVCYGRGEGVVVSTGMNTETGKIAKLLTSNENQTTPLQKKLTQISKALGIITLVLVLLIFGVQMIRVFTTKNINNWAPSVIDNFMFSISLAVAAIPEGLPAVVTIVLALGVQKMVKANTIVRKLPAVETLGGVNVVCSDKTGTLTQNRMTVACAYQDQTFYESQALANEKLSFLAKGLALCNNASVENGIFGDPTEIALIEFALSHHLTKSNLEEEFPRKDEIPFDSVRKMMTTKHQIGKGSDYIIYTKGALDSVIDRCSKISINGKITNLSEKDRIDILQASDAMAKGALRVLALAYKENKTMSEDNLVFIGLVGMIDPPRTEAKGAVQLFKQAGITTIMITGDHKITALAIAKELGIADNFAQALSGDEIDKLSPEELREAVKKIRVFARVSPTNKVDIVQAIKANGDIVAMTGDGVNDAPSLKAADIGIAMGITGTDVAKSAADMILTDDNFASIEKAVEEGRGIYTNIKKTVIFLLGSNLAEVLTMFIVVALSLFAGHYNLPTPLISVHVLWVNLITDSLPAIALGADEKDKNVMKAEPRGKKESLFSKGGAPTMIGYGILISLITLIAFFTATIVNGGIELRSISYVFKETCRVLNDEESVRMTAQTTAFCTLSLTQLFYMLGITSMRKSFIHNFTSKNFLLWIAFGLGLLLQFAVVEIPGINTFFKCSPLDVKQWIMILVLSVIPLLVHEIVAFILLIRRKIKHLK